MTLGDHLLFGGSRHRFWRGSGHRHRHHLCLSLTSCWCLSQNPRVASNHDSPKSPSDASLHTGWDAYNRGQSVGRVSIDSASILCLSTHLLFLQTPSAASSCPPLNSAGQTQTNDAFSTESTGGVHIPLLRPYSRQSPYPQANSTNHQGTHHTYQSTQGPWDESPDTQDGDPFLWSNRRNDGVSGSYQTCSPQPRTGRLGVPFYPQGPDPIHASIGQIASEVKRISAQVTKLMETDKERTETIKRSQTSESAQDGS